MKKLVFFMALLLIAGCGEGPAWQTKDVTGVLPDLAFRLTDETGNKVTEQAYRGRVSAVFFGFTNCPDICPINLGKLRSAIGELPESARDDIRVLFISVDPQRDQPGTLAEYTEFFGPEFIGLTADEATLRSLTKRYRATFSYGEPDDRGEYTVSHPSAIYVFDGHGSARLLFRQDDSVEAMAGDLEHLVSMEDDRNTEPISNTVTMTFTRSNGLWPACL